MSNRRGVSDWPIRKRMSGKVWRNEKIRCEHLISFAGLLITNKINKAIYTILRESWLSDRRHWSGNGRIPWRCTIQKYGHNMATIPIRMFDVPNIRIFCFWESLQSGRSRKVPSQEISIPSSEDYHTTKDAELRSVSNAATRYSEYWMIKQREKHSKYTYGKTPSIYDQSGVRELSVNINTQTSI